jgi:TrmH family RNA methyltransferase
VADPGNVGTLLRAADALGPAALWLSDGCADPTGPKAVRASAGAIFRVGVGQLDDAPRPWLALVARDGEAIDAAELPAGTMLLGAEREGLPQELLARCERRLTIPQTGDAESLNVAMAGSIALWERRRRSG